jgi:transposase
MSEKKDPEKVVRDIKRKTRLKFSAEEKIRIVLEGLRGEESIAELCRREGISPNLYYCWSKDFCHGQTRLNMATFCMVSPYSIQISSSTKHFDE